MTKHYYGGVDSIHIVFLRWIKITTFSLLMGSTRDWTCVPLTQLIEGYTRSSWCPRWPRLWLDRNVLLSPTFVWRERRMTWRSHTRLGWDSARRPLSMGWFADAAGGHRVQLRHLFPITIFSTVITAYVSRPCREWVNKNGRCDSRKRTRSLTSLEASIN